MEKRFCECGCQKELSFAQERFLHGHNRRGLISNTKGERWSRGYDRCLGCGTTERSHQREGLCNACARRAINSGKIEKKRGIDQWAKGYDACVDCGRADRAHSAHGRCGTCRMNFDNRSKGVPHRNFGEWSWYYRSCIRCQTTEIPHAAGGLCDRCYQASVRGVQNTNTCPVCFAPVRKLFQHISMKAKTCFEHEKYLLLQEDKAKELFSSDKPANEISRENIFGKRFVLKTWHKYFSNEEIVSRGENIRVSKISGANNYLYGRPFPAIQPSITEHVSPSGKVYNMKSSWEIEFAKELEKRGIEYLYEAEGFAYADLEGGAHYYWPDFYLPILDLFVEIKGFMDDKSQHKIEEFRRNHEDKKLIIIQSLDEMKGVLDDLDR